MSSNGNSHGTGYRQIVEFPTNVPVTVELAYATPRSIQTKLGDRAMFTLTDGRVMFLDPAQGERIVAAGIQPNQPFTITKSERKDGSRKVIAWEMRRMKNDGPAPEKMIGESLTPTRTPIEPRPTVANAAGEIRTQNSTLSDSLHAAINAAAEAEEYAKNRDYALRFTSEDIRAIGLTIYINHQRGRS